ncbi:MAG: hypothetical protein E7313_08260 [Clostridiales bacterium]|nr:hypothetical protein [Clostridiales bacterium]
MPNYCTNIIKAPKKVLEDLYDGKKVTFQKLIPMPKTLILTCGDRTDEAVLYSLLCKDIKTRDKTIELLNNTKEHFYASYWDKLKKRYTLETIDLLNKKAKVFVPTEEERKLEIKSFRELGDMYINNLIKYKSMTWYDWSIENWGTKWDAVDSEGTPEDGELKFLTAWAEPIPIIKKLFEKYPKMRIEWEYELEGEEYSGKYISDGKGKITKEEYEIQVEDDEEDEI